MMAYWHWYLVLVFRINGIFGLEMKATTNSTMPPDFLDVTDKFTSSDHGMTTGSNGGESASIQTQRYFTGYSEPRRNDFQSYFTETSYETPTEDSCRIDKMSGALSCSETDVGTVATDIRELTTYIDESPGTVYGDVRTANQQVTTNGRRNTTRDLENTNNTSEPRITTQNITNSFRKLETIVPTTTYADKVVARNSTIEHNASLTDLESGSLVEFSEVNPYCFHPYLTKLIDVNSLKTIKSSCLSVILIIGIPSNLVTILVFSSWDRKAKTPGSFYLVAIAIADLIFLISIGLLRELMTIFVPYGHWSHGPLCRYNAVISSAAHSAVIWLVVAFAVERHIAVCHPLRKRYLSTIQRTRIIISLIYISCTILAVPKFFDLKYIRVTYTTNNNNTTVTKSYDICIYSDHGGEIFRIATEWGTTLLIFVPYITIITLNALVIRALRRRNNFLRSLSSRVGIKVKRRQHTITMVLLTVSFSFILSWGPTLCIKFYSCIQSMGVEIKSAPLAIGVLQLTSQVCENFNCAINFILYCILSSRYRNSLSRLGAVRGRGKAPPVAKSTTHAGFLSQWSHSVWSSLSLTKFKKTAKNSGPAGLRTQDKIVETP
ncbi:thyrotropin-releasing hormone receptor-like [Ptychodera flava]|uniref:thyrotropin-releasing hormone receptor-like n=1 Tax=Ptychodera flava TaxID=63121 RepID=UPI00396A8C5A